MDGTGRVSNQPHIQEWSLFSSGLTTSVHSLCDPRRTAPQPGRARSVLASRCRPICVSAPWLSDTAGGGGREPGCQDAVGP